jgi:hypothetical protein
MHALALQQMSETRAAQRVEIIITKREVPIAPRW